VSGQATPHGPDEGAASAARVERRWASVCVVIVVVLVVMAAFAGIHQATMPQPRIQLADPHRLQLSGEFIEGNLGSALEPDGSVTVRAVGQQYSFTPQCILIPTDTKVTVKATSADVVHGFLIDGTNINTMLIPGYVSSMLMRFDAPGERVMPCHEFCGAGHEGMWGRIRIIPKEEFLRLAANRRRLNCVK
jgi:cytochrome c oxidase subunit 2